jgi:hypothetical protein
MDRPDPALSLERAVVRWVPIAAGVYWDSTLSEVGNITIEYRNYGVPIRHREGAAGQEVVLHIYDD